MPDALNAADIQEYLDREAIRDVLFRYAHGIDRCDAKLLETVYWPEGVDDHGDFKGTRDAFIAWVMPLLKELMSTTQHLMSNIFIRVEGNLAKVETCFQAYHRWGRYDADDARDFVLGGRYLDKMEKRGKEWRILERVVIFDYFREYGDTGNWKKSKSINERRALGSRSPDDPASKLFGESRLRPPFV